MHLAHRPPVLLGHTRVVADLDAPRRVQPIDAGALTKALAKVLIKKKIKLF